MKVAVVGVVMGGGGVKLSFNGFLPVLTRRKGSENPGTSPKIPIHISEIQKNDLKTRGSLMC